MTLDDDNETTMYPGHPQDAPSCDLRPESQYLMPNTSEPRTLKIRVLVRPKEGILDPQGEAVRGALPALGFGGVKTVHIGRLIEMEVESADEVDAMCRRLLSNPTIEEYEWEVVS
jgi:phosphoribosylformylglycinamidine synthase